MLASQITYEVPEIQKIYFRPDGRKVNNMRLNILVPSVDDKHVFGGISTALKFFELLGETLDCELRIIVTDSHVDLKTSIKLDGFMVVSCDDISDYGKQIIPFSNRYDKTIEVRKNDVFIATAWWTAYTIVDVIKAQSEYYHIQIKPLIYFIQDYEPGFYAWSSRYFMTECTYNIGEGEEEASYSVTFSEVTSTMI